MYDKIVYHNPYHCVIRGTSLTVNVQVPISASVHVRFTSAIPISRLSLRGRQIHEVTMEQPR